MYILNNVYQATSTNIANRPTTGIYNTIWKTKATKYRKRDVCYDFYEKYSLHTLQRIGRFTITAQHFCKSALNSSPINSWRVWISTLYINVCTYIILRHDSWTMFKPSVRVQSIRCEYRPGLYGRHVSCFIPSREESWLPKWSEVMLEGREGVSKYPFVVDVLWAIIWAQTTEKVKSFQIILFEEGRVCQEGESEGLQLQWLKIQEVCHYLQLIMVHFLLKSVPSS